MRGERKHRRGGNDGSFWLSFSDLMSSLVLIIILVMFYIIYQYFNEAETNARVIAAREAELDATQAQLTAAQSDLDSAQSELEEQQSLLAVREDELAAAQSNLETAQSNLETAQSNLQTAQTDLDTATAALAERETQVAQQQTQLDELSQQLTDKQAEIDSQKTQLETQQKQLEQLVGLRTRLVSDISNAFKENNINATVDPTNGSIALETDVMFTSGDAELSDTGKYFLDTILPVYLKVLFSDEYRPYVTEIIIEGHTDSDGTWLKNLELSQQRAFAVASYVLSTDCKTISSDIKNQLRDIVTVNGRSYSERVFDANGAEDKDASRRVVFKFRLTDEQMIANLQQILENEGVN